MFSAKYLAFVALVASTLVQAAPHKHSSNSQYTPPPPPPPPQLVHSLTYCYPGGPSKGCYTHKLLDGVCTEVTSAANDKITKFQQDSTTHLAVPAGMTCTAYADPFCGGVSYNIPSRGGRIPSSSGFTSSNGVTTLRCSIGTGQDDLTNAEGSALKDVPMINVTYGVNTYFSPGYNATANVGHQLALDGGCNEIPQPWFQNILSFDPTNQVSCNLYPQYFCGGSPWTVNSRTNNISPGSNPYLRSFSCGFVNYD